MGMYTELVLSAMIRNDPEVIAVLNYMGKGEGWNPPADLKIPDHPFFQTTRWNSLFRSCSFYFVPYSIFSLTFNEISNAWVLISRSDLKNYADEIGNFIDWIKPHLDDHHGQMIGYSRYEEERHPTILYAPGGEDEPA